MTNDLQASLEAISATHRGAHPDPDDLLAYHLGELDPEATEAIEEHVALCSDCSRHVLDMDRFLNGEPPQGAEPVNDFAAERLRQSVERALMAPDTTPGPFYAGLGFARAAAAAFFLTSAALAGYLALSPKVTSPKGTLANLPIVELSVAEIRESGERDEIRLPRETPGAVLVFPLARTHTFSQYEVTFERTGSEIVFRRRGLRRTADGLLTLTVQRDLLSPGSFDVRLYGLEGDAETLEPQVLEPQPVANFRIEWRPE